MMPIKSIERRWRLRQRPDVLILDNRDSFVFNLAHRFYELGARCSVVRSDEITVDEIRRAQPRRLVISPGPGHPRDAGVSVAAARELAQEVPILGICLGHQAIVEAYGGVVGEDGAPVHGQDTLIEHDERGIFRGIETPVRVGRYHSLAAREPVPPILEVSARGAGLVMAVRHREFPVIGVQFHPESVLTPAGYSLLGQFLVMSD